MNKKLILKVVVIAVLVLLIFGSAVFFMVKKFASAPQSPQFNNAPTKLSVPDTPKIELLRGDEAVKHLKEVISEEEANKILNNSSSSRK